MRFAAGADLSRPKGDSKRDRYSLTDARSKAKLILRKAPAQSRHVAHKTGQEPHWHSMREAGYWTAERKRCHQSGAAMLGLATSRLAVNQAMLDATPTETGQCGAMVGNLMAVTRLSMSAVKSSRRDLVQGGLWIVERSTYIPSLPQAVDEPAPNDGASQAA
jgi:hypothetical protein